MQENLANAKVSAWQPSYYSKRHSSSGKIPRLIELIGQGHPRSMILVSVESAYATFY